MSYGPWVTSLESWVSSLKSRTYWTRQPHLDLPFFFHRTIELVAPSVWRGSSGITLGAAPVDGAHGPFGDLAPMTRGFWQCKPIGRGVLWTPQIVKVIVHVHSSACLDAAGDAIVESRTMNVPTALQGCFNTVSALPVLTVLPYEPSTLKFSKLSCSTWLLSGVKWWIYTPWQLTAHSCLMVGIWVLRRFPYDVTTGHCDWRGITILAWGLRWLQWVKFYFWGWWTPLCLM